MAGEFKLIDKLFAGHDAAKGVMLGVGDDCALIAPPGTQYLALTTDTMVEGRHFFAGTKPYYLGWRALAVNLSDLAAMGARPRYFLLSITHPDGNKRFLKSFAQGMFALAKEEKVALIGGNMAKGPLSITITAIGTCKPGRAMERSGAQVGDELYVTGTLGGPGLYVKAGMGELKLSPSLMAELYAKAFLLPCRARFAKRLAKICRCAIDISDGLVGDLRHICTQSQVGAQVVLDTLPLPPEFLLPEVTARLSLDERLHLALYGGCDYELLFSLAPDKVPTMLSLAQRYQVPVTKIGLITHRRQGLQLYFQGQRQTLKPGFEHF